jgi:membrane protein YqaA with SNARE-associated domain
MKAYLLMFGGAFLAATILPFYSEVIVVGIVVDRPEEWVWIWLVASLGNTLGSAANESQLYLVLDPDLCGESRSLSCAD